MFPVVQMADLLGGDAVLGPVRTELEVADLVRRGAPAESVARLAEHGLGYGVIESHVLPRRTLHRRRQTGGRLNREESDRLLRLARVVALAEDVFGSAEAARNWLRRPTRPLGGLTPLELADSDAGVRTIEDLLGRISHGIAA